jgi:hypothetical protein
VGGKYNRSLGSAERFDCAGCDGKSRTGTHVDGSIGFDGKGGAVLHRDIAGDDIGTFCCGPYGVCRDATAGLRLGRSSQGKRSKAQPRAYAQEQSDS